MSVVGDNIRTLRIHRGLSQTELAEAIGESKQLLYKYESGVVTNIPISKIEAIARVLHCTPESLVGWDDNLPVSASADPLPQVTMIGRAMERSTPEKREQMLQLLKIAFPEEFE